MDSTRIVITDRLFDGRDLRDGGERTAVAIIDGAIAALGAAEDVIGQYPEAVVDEFPGATSLPGFIDCHVHCTMPGDGTPPDDAAAQDMSIRHENARRNLAAHLASGVTTVRDLGSHEDFLEFRIDSAKMPQLLRCGPPLTAAHGHMHFFGGASGSASEAVTRMNRSLDMGADGVKVVGSGGGTIGTVPHETTLSTDWIETIVANAHQRGRIATTHALSAEGVRRAITAGSDGIEHLAFMDDHGVSAAAPPADVLELARQRGTAFGSTLSVNYRYIELADRGLVDPRELEEQRTRTDDYLRGAGAVHSAGVRLVTGSDAGWKFTPFGDFALELELLVRAGLSPTAALTAATSAAADYLRLKSRGVLAPGAYADLVVVLGDPTAAIADARNVAAVYRDGRPLVDSR